MRLGHLWLIGIMVITACGSGPSTQQIPAEEAEKLLINRNWQDAWPQSHDEPLHVFRFVPSMGGGVYQDRTLFAGTFELFRYEVESDRIAFDLPHKKQKETSAFRIEKVSGPEPFDLRLILFESPRGPSIYYGRSSETFSGSLLSPIAKN